MIINGRRCFEDFEYVDFNTYRNRLLIRELQFILDENGKLLPEDLKKAYDKTMVIIQQDLDLVSKKWCFLRNSSDRSVNTSKCCLAQFEDVQALQRDAFELAHNMKSYLAFRIYDQPDDTRPQILDDLRNVFTMSSHEGEIKSGATFPGFFQELIDEMNEIDEGTSGEDFQLKPKFESLLREVVPRIVLKMKKYYENSSLGYDECQFCKSCSVEKPNLKNLRYIPSFQTPEELESFLTLMFRRSFYTELRDFLKDINSFFSDDGKMNLSD